MKILIISKGIPTKKNPQFGCFAMDQAKALQALGHEVAIMFVNGFIGKIWKKPGFYYWTQDNIQCYESYGYPTAILKKMVNLSLGLALEKWWSRKIFKKIIDDFGFPDIVHAHYLECMVIGAAIKEKYPITLVGTEHWSRLVEPTISSDVRVYGNYAYHQLNKLICVSKMLSNIVEQRFNIKSEVVYNLLDTDILLPAIANTENEKFIISAVGSLIPRKGFDILIKALAQSELANLNVNLNIYGKGPIHQELQDLIKQLNLENKVTLCGQKSREEIYDALRSSDLFVLSSRQETFSVAVIEALANGAPSVATSCGIIVELQLDGVIKIPINNIDAMAKALEYAYHTKGSIDRIALQKNIVKLFSPDTLAQKLEKIYVDLIKEKET